MYVLEAMSGEVETPSRCHYYLKKKCSERKNDLMKNYHFYKCVSCDFPIDRVCMLSISIRFAGCVIGTSAARFLFSTRFFLFMKWPKNVLRPFCQFAASVCGRLSQLCSNGGVLCCEKIWLSTFSYETTLSEGFPATRRPVTTNF